MRALRTAASGMAAQQLNVEVISNNIANMNTVGFKKQRAEFQDLLYQNIERMGAQSSSQGNVVPTGIQVGAGVKAGAVYRITEQGTPQHTGNPYDMAIDGKGVPTWVRFCSFPYPGLVHAASACSQKVTKSRACTS